MLPELAPMLLISTHAPLARCDGHRLHQVLHYHRISTHAPLARCDFKAIVTALTDGISTHAPLARCDPLSFFRGFSPRISTHAPLARCDHTGGQINVSPPISTHAPLARCDCAADRGNRNGTDFNSRTSCEVRRLPGPTRSTPSFISTHAPLARCDLPHMVYNIVTRLFQLTHLLRGATNLRVLPGDLTLISTHAPLARCDPVPGSSLPSVQISTHAPLARCDF